MPSPTSHAQVRQGWRDLGFFYDRDDEARVWRLVGSRDGLAGFCRLLRRYAADPRNALPSEHEHFGPYQYLEVMTWAEPSIDSHAIAGRPEDLARLADLVEERIGAATPGDRLPVGSEYAPALEYALEIEVASDGFDPASLDPFCVDQPT